MSKKEQCQRIYYGGQALLEGVMMKGTGHCGCAVRNEKGEIVKTVVPVQSVAKKHRFLALPFIRGVVNFIEMMKLGFQTLAYSAEVSGMAEEEEAEPSRFESWLSEKCGKHMMDIIMGISLVLGLALAVLLFMALPAGITKLTSSFLPPWSLTIIEGVIKIAIFVGYLAVVAQMKDIRRTFEYHGAEHKTIHCFEAGEELTPENVRKYPREHPRCGTSFMILVLMISILIFWFVTWDNLIIRILLKIVLLPVTMGVAYECIRLAGRYDNVFTRMISAPGRALQKLTTREPDDAQIECAIAALKIVLETEIPGSYPGVLEGVRHSFKTEETEQNSGSEDGAPRSGSDGAEA